MVNVQLERSAGVHSRTTAYAKGIVALMVCAVLLIGCFLPAFSWIRMTNTEALYDVMKLKKSVIEQVTGEYSLFNFLSFV